MSIHKKGNTNFLRNTGVPHINDAATSTPVVSEKTENAPRQEEEKAHAKSKEVGNWGRPRKSLIDGVKEKSVTVQLPVNLITALRKEGRKTKKSMKEVIGEALLDKYGELIK